jgi:hypothetical protein
VVNLMEALRRSVGGRAAEATVKSLGKTAKKPRKAATSVRLKSREVPGPLLGAHLEASMDEKEASAMTEASGLRNDQAGLESASGGTAAGQLETQLRSFIAGLSAQLWQTTLEAPLRSLFLAFILGV